MVTFSQAASTTIQHYLRYHLVPAYDCKDPAFKGRIALQKNVYGLPNDAEELERVRKTAFTFAIFRNPFERLASAYCNKMWHREEGADLETRDGQEMVYR